MDDYCIYIARATEMSVDYSKKHQVDSSETSGFTSVSIVQPYAFDSVYVLQINRQQKKNKQLQRQQQGMKSTYCGTCLHPRAGCPAKLEKCHKCGTAGHSARVCRSSSIAALGDVDSEDSISTVSCCLSDITTTKQTVHEDVLFNRVKAVTALIDLGATDCFITL